MRYLSIFDHSFFLVYFLIISIYCAWMYRRKKSASEDLKGYFFAYGSLTWRAIVTFLVASNVSSGQLIRMSGSKFRIVLTIASLEWVAAVKLLTVLLPGIAAPSLSRHHAFRHKRPQNGGLYSERAYLNLLNYLASRLKWLSFAALTATVVASLVGKPESIAIILLRNICKKPIALRSKEVKLFVVGRITVLAVVTLAVIIVPLLSIDNKRGFQYIEGNTSFLLLGIIATFFLGFFWKSANSWAAKFDTNCGLVLSVLLKFLPPRRDLAFLSPSRLSKLVGNGRFEVPVPDLMKAVFVICNPGMYMTSDFQQRKGDQLKGLEIHKPSAKYYPHLLPVRCY